MTCRRHRRHGQRHHRQYKVSIAYRDGFMAAGTLVIAGPNAAAKARRSGAILLGEAAAGRLHVCRVERRSLGAGDCVPGVVTAQGDPPEVVLRVAVRDPRRAAVERFTKEFAPLVTSGSPARPATPPAGRRCAKCSPTGRR